MIDIDLLLFIALILLSTKVLSMFMKKMHLPQVVGALIAGVLLGPAVFNLVEPNETITDNYCCGRVWGYTITLYCRDGNRF